MAIALIGAPSAFSNLSGNAHNINKLDSILSKLVKFSKTNILLLSIL